MKKFGYRFGKIYRQFIVAILFLVLFFLNFSQVSAATFTAGMAKRDAPGPFAAGPILQGGWASSGAYGDGVDVSRGTQIVNNFYQNIDYDQGSISLWVTPEWNGNDGVAHVILYAASNFVLQKGGSNYLTLTVGTQSASMLIGSWTAGTTYHVVGRWDTKNTLDGTNYISVTVNDTAPTFGGASAPSPTTTGGTYYIGSQNEHRTLVNGTVEGLTLYRRPLWDGSYGINVGNGDEISAIYNSGSGKDPTLVTGSWDVVFALPTNSTTGALSTGTGEAWSHPHSSNLLYTNTTNTGGFMMNGTYTSDGWNVSGSLTPTDSTGNSLSFDGGDFVTIPDPGGDSGDLTVTSWFKTSDAGNVVVIANEGSDPDWLWTVYKNSDNKFACRIYQIDTGSEYLEAISSAATYNDGNWHHIACTLSGDTLTAYIDGVSVGSDNTTTGTRDTSSAGDIHIGRMYFIANNFNWVGNIDNFKFYTRALTQQEVKDTMYKTSLSSSEQTNLVGWWKFDDASGQTVTDSSGNNYNGTLGIDSGSSTDDPTWSTSAPLPTVSALATSEKIFAGGYKYTSSAASEGIYYDKTVVAGDDWVVRGLANSDGTCTPKIILYDQTNAAEIGSLTGTTTSTRTAPDTFIFTGQAPASSTTLRVKLINTASSGTCYWHQIEVLSNQINDPGTDSGSGDPWLPSGWGAGILTSGMTAQETSITHGSSSSLKFTSTASSGNYLSINSSGLTSGVFYATGAYTYGDGSSTYLQMQIGNGSTVNRQDGTADVSLNLSNTAAWTHNAVVVRSVNGGAQGRQINITNNPTGNRYLDDVYMYPLTSVSLTVTPASQANSTENTDEIRVDGRDTYTSPSSEATSIETASGYVSFNWRPRHSAANGVKWAETANDDAYIVSFAGDSDDYINVYWDSANTIKMEYSMAGTTGSGTWDATGAISANTEYTASLSYTGGGTMVFTIGGTDRITLSSIPSAFGTAPDTIYWGSNTSGGNQGDSTFSSFDFDSVAPSITLTSFSPDPTTDNTPSFTGTAIDTQNVITDIEYQIDSTSGSWTNCTADDGGIDETSETFTCTPSTLADGSHTIYIRATDAASNVSSNSTDTFSVDTVSPNDFSLDSPGDKSYINGERPSFKWKAASIPDTTTSLTKYFLFVDNGDNGDFSVDNIPVSGTSDIVSDRYIIHFEGFSDSDNSNNYIQVTTKSSSVWDGNQNDGKVKEGKRYFAVTTYDTAGNSRSTSRTFFTDRSAPKPNVTKINDRSVVLEENKLYSTQDLTPKIEGEILDIREGDNIDNKAASGPKSVTLEIDKKNTFGNYINNRKITLNIDKTYWENSGKEITSSDSNTDNKKGSFSYTFSDKLDYGIYKVMVTGKDAAGNDGNKKTFYLEITDAGEVSLPIGKYKELEEEIRKEQPEITAEELKKEIEDIFRENITEKTYTYPNTLEKIVSGLSAFPEKIYWKSVNAAKAIIGVYEQSLNSLSFVFVKYSNSVQNLARNSQGPLVNISSGINQNLNGINQNLSAIGSAIGNNVSKTANTLISSALGTSKTLENINNVAASRLSLAGKNIEIFTNKQKVKLETVSEILFDDRQTIISNVQETLLSPTSVKISWETNQHSTGKVNYGYKEGDYDFEIQTTERSTYHEFTITNLNPDTEYHYEVLSQSPRGGFVYDANRKFKTPKE